MHRSESMGCFPSVSPLAACYLRPCETRSYHSILLGLRRFYFPCLSLIYLPYGGNGRIGRTFNGNPFCVY